MKKIKNSKDEYHLNSKYWQEWKRQQINEHLFQICIGMVLSDATMYRVSREAYMKFEQGSQQFEFIQHLFAEMQQYVFIENIGIRHKGMEQSKAIGLKLLVIPVFQIYLKNFIQITHEKVFSKVSFYRTSRKKV